MNENDWVRTKDGVFTRILSLTKLHKTTMIECLNGVTYTQKDIKLSSPSLLELIKNKDMVIVWHMLIYLLEKSYIIMMKV